MDYQETFVRSWDILEHGATVRGRDFPAELAASIQALVREMRRRGYDRIFHAGTAAFNIVLSRSAEHGLRTDQPSVSLHLNRTVLSVFEDRRMGVSYGAGDRTHFVEERYELTPRLEAALADLARAPID